MSLPLEVKWFWHIWLGASPRFSPSPQLNKHPSSSPDCATLSLRQILDSLWARRSWEKVKGAGSLKPQRLNSALLLRANIHDPFFFWLKESCFMTTNQGDILIMWLSGRTFVWYFWPVFRFSFNALAQLSRHLQEAQSWSQLFSPIYMLFTVGGVVQSDLMLAPIGIIAPLKHDFCNSA